MTEDTAIANRQPKLFNLESVLFTRLGTEFFRAVPRSPGVYFFHDHADKLLYIGQSSDLRARLNSYRHVSPEKNPKRTLRLVARTTRIEWELCESASAAIERERVLLLERRPPFNRAGVWKGEPWWLSMEVEGQTLYLNLSHEPAEGSVGPLPPSCRYVLASVVRAMLRVANPDWRLSDFPHGLMRAALPKTTQVTLPNPSDVLCRFRGWITGELPNLLCSLTTLSLSASETERLFWQEEYDRLEQHSTAPLVKC